MLKVLAMHMQGRREGYGTCILVGQPPCNFTNYLLPSLLFLYLNRFNIIISLIIFLKGKELIFFSKNVWLNFQYIFGVVILLLAECVTAIITVICPDYLGLRFERESLTEMWQHTYSVPGKEQYTVAIDLVQVKVRFLYCTFHFFSVRNKQM